VHGEPNPNRGMGFNLNAESVPSAAAVGGLSEHARVGLYRADDSAAWFEHRVLSGLAGNCGHARGVIRGTQKT